MKKTFNYCLKNELLGVGWRVDINNTNNWDLYAQKAAEENYAHDLTICAYIKNNVTPGDLVWTRSDTGCYFLGKVITGWEYFETGESKSENIDIANIFRVKLISVEPIEVPGRIVASFRPSKTIQRISSLTATEYTKNLWNIKTSSQDYRVDFGLAANFFDIIDDEETEDIVLMYLQSEGWILQPNSRKKDTMSYEFITYNPKTNEHAITQVKTGGTSIDCETYAKFDCTVFLFQPNEKYLGEHYDNIIKISPECLMSFTKSNRSWLPKTIQYKLDISAKLSAL